MYIRSLQNLRPQYDQKRNCSFQLPVPVACAELSAARAWKCLHMRLGAQVLELFACRRAPMAWNDSDMHSTTSRDCD